MKLTLRLLWGIALVVLLLSAVMFTSYYTGISRDALPDISTKSSDIKNTIVGGGIYTDDTEAISTNNNMLLSFNKHETKISSSSTSEQKRKSASLSLTFALDNDKMDRFKRRNKIAEKSCKQFKSGELKLRESVEERTFFHRPFANGKLEWCVVFKSGSTFTRFVNASFPAEKRARNSHDTPGMSRSRFVIVREPYSRLMAGYVDKFVADKDFQLHNTGSIIKLFRPNASAKEIACATDVTFQEFVKYFIYSHTSGWFQNCHFHPITKHCDPCKQRIDFIAHLDTYEEDMREILKTVTMNAVFPESEDTAVMKRKLTNTLKRIGKWGGCLSKHRHLLRLWWVFQTRGFIARAMIFGLTEKESETALLEDLINVFLDAHLNSIGRFDKYQQKRKYMVELFLQIPLEDRMKVRDILMKDFLVYGYDPQPDDLFPEFVDQKP